MTNKRLKDEDVALFRYGVIAPLLLRTKEWGTRAIKLEELTKENWTLPNGQKSKIPKGTIKDWLRKYNKDGFDGLYPKTRSDKGNSRKLTEEQVERIIAFRKKYPELIVTELYEKMLKQDLLLPGEVSTSTLNRLFNNNDLSRKKLLSKSFVRDMKPFNFPYRNDCWQVDVLHGPKISKGKKKNKAYLIAFLDDKTRIIPAAGFVWSEKTDNLAAMFIKAITKRGVPNRLYADNGKVFCSKTLKLVCARLGIELIHSRPYTPEGRGKIERFFRTVRSSFLTPFLVEESNSTIEKLNNAFYDWVDNKYHCRIHRGLDGCSPLDSWVQDNAVVRRISTSVNLEYLFLNTEERTVLRDCTIYFKKRRFEVPPKYRSRRINIRYDPTNLNQVFLETTSGELIKLRFVDCIENRLIKRK